MRGQQGTDAFVPDTWPVGSKIILLDGAVSPLELPLNQRGVQQTYRVGPSGRAVNDAAYREQIFAVQGQVFARIVPAICRCSAATASSLRSG